MVGTTLGHYRILRLLGSGGMGEVYAAEDTKLGRHVALKVLPQLVADDPERRRRFEQEARAVAALNHPSIVTLHSVEEANGTLFLTMELVDGRPLDELVPKGGLPLQRLLRIAIPLADALAAAHDRGITHRDLKPANVMVTADDRVKVLDFGLAKLREAKLAESGSALPTRDMTGEGRILGTVAYMSPEQAEGKPIDHRSDLFSFGIVLYQMATGQRPFRGETNVSIISAIIKDTPHSVSDLRQDLPRDLTRIVKRCLVKDPEHRYQTAKDLRNDLELLKEEIDSGEMLAASSAAAAPARRSRWSAGRVAAAVVVAGLVVGAAGWGISRLRTPGATPSADRYRDLKISTLTTSGKAYVAAISRDGKYAAYADAEASRQTVWVRQVATRSNVQIVPPFEGRIEGLTFSPDGNHVFYVMYAKGENIASLYQVPALGGTPRKLVVDIDGPVTFSPDGKRFAFVRGYVREGQAALLVANVDGTGERRLATSRAPETFELRSAAWSPDGKTIVVLKPEVTPVRSMLFVAVDAESGQASPIGSTRLTAISSVAWVPDGTALLATAFDRDRGPGHQIWLVSYPDGQARKITNDLNGFFGMSVTADGRTLLAMQGNAMGNMWLAPGGDARRAVPITSGTKFAGAGGIDWTPDGRIVYVSGESGNADIWIMNADGTNVKQLTVDPAGDFNPMVTPDGRFVVFVSNRGGQADLWRMDLDGANQTRLTNGAQPGGRALVDGGKRVIYTSFGTAARSTWTIPIEGGEPTRVFAPDAGDEPLPSIGVLGASPDGAIVLVSYLDREQRGWRQATVSLADRKVLNRFNLRGAITWSADGRALHHTDFKNGAWNIWSQPIDGGPAKPVTNFTTGEMIFTFAWSRDGKQLACTRGTSTNDVVLISSVP